MSRLDDAPLPLTTKRLQLVRFDGSSAHEDQDLVAVEEPLEIRFDRDPLVVTMRTPGQDEELCAGWLVSEGVVRRSDDLRCVEPSADLAANVIEFELSSGVEWAPRNLKRNFYTTSACGVCGKAAIEALQMTAGRLESNLSVDRDILLSLPEQLGQSQGGFARTGGLHAAGLFSASGEKLVVREDVGRHNALDKAIGWALLNDRLPLRDMLIFVSGRLSFELTQKAIVAGAPLLAGVSAPSSLAVELANESDLTLCGFVREGQMNVYSAPQRVVD